MQWVTFSWDGLLIYSIKMKLWKRFCFIGHNYLEFPWWHRLILVRRSFQGNMPIWEITRTYICLLTESFRIRCILWRKWTNPLVKSTDFLLQESQNQLCWFSTYQLSKKHPRCLENLLMSQIHKLPLNWHQIFDPAWSGRSPYCYPYLTWI